MTGKIFKATDLEKRRSLEDQVKPEKTHKSVDELVEAGGVIDKKSLEARSKAETIIAEAEAKAAKIHEKAQKILNQVGGIREKAKKEGFAEGEAEGLSQVTEKLVQLESMKEQFHREAEPEIIKLVLNIAEKIIGKIVEEHPDVIRDVVRQALEKSLGDRISVRVNPDDYRTIIENNFEFKDVLDRTKRLHFKEDESVAKGGCIVETEVGTIDAQIETQMEAIKKALVS